MMANMGYGNLLIVAISTIASGLSLSYGVAMFIAAQYVTALLLCGIGIYSFGWACASGR
jgi:hypothetical protein